MSGKAESRLIYSTISTSERVASLGAKGALLYTWLISHCDSQGRMQGKSKTIQVTVCPLVEEITTEDVAEALEKMAEQNLIIKYKDDKGRELIQIKDWWDWQKGLQYKSPSHYKAPPEWEDRVTPRDEKGQFTKEED